MFEKYVPCLSEDGEESNLVSPMDVAVTAASQFLRTKIKDIAETKGGKRDGVGVVSRYWRMTSYIDLSIYDMLI